MGIILLRIFGDIFEDINDGFIEDITDDKKIFLETMFGHYKKVMNN